jgi:hypothetical protein
LHILAGSTVDRASTKEAVMKRGTRVASKRKPKTRVINDAPRGGEVAEAAQVSSRRKPAKAA